RQTDNGISAPAFAALNRFKQKRLRAGGEFQIGGQRGIQIRENLAEYGNVGKPRLAEGIESLLVHGKPCAGKTETKKTRAGSPPGMVGAPAFRKAKVGGHLDSFLQQ